METNGFDGQKRDDDRGNINEQNDYILLRDDGNE